MNRLQSEIKDYRKKKGLSQYDLAVILGVTRSKIRIHDFRHSHASYLINSGIPIKAVSQRLGHSSVKTTMDVYWHLMDKDEANILKLLNK